MLKVYTVPGGSDRNSVTLVATRVVWEQITVVVPVLKYTINRAIQGSESNSLIRITFPATAATDILNAISRIT